jgi:hypothetical protein
MNAKNKMNEKNTAATACARVLGLGLLLVLFHGVAAAQDPQHDLQDLVGSRGGSGEQALMDRGYVFVKSEVGADRVFANWWNRSTGTCISVSTMNGRYAAITNAPPFDCDRDSGSQGNSDHRREWVADLIGARGSAMDGEMSNRGFNNVDSLKEDSGRATTWWYNRDSGACLRVWVEDGRITDITPTPHYPACQ